MNGWIVALLGVYVIGVAGMAFYLKGANSPAKGMFILFWPFTLLWMLYGVFNEQGLDQLRSRWDRFLDWLEFDVWRWGKRHWIVTLLVALVVATLLICVVSLARAASVPPNPEQQYLLLPMGTVEALVNCLEKLEAENADLRERCGAGVRGT